VVRGRSLDGTKIASRGSGNAAAGGGTGATGGTDMTLEGPFKISARVDRLMMRENVAIAPFSLEVSGTGDRLAAASLSGTMAKGATIAGEMAPSGTGRKLTFASSDLGQLAKGVFGFASLRGGKADLVANFPGAAGDTAPREGPDFQGKLTLSDFKVMNQPFLARLFAAGSLDGLADLMQGQGIAIQKLDAPFSSKNGVIEIRGGRAAGPAIGVTADGWIDRPKNAIALKGTLAPLIGINGFLSDIPIVGDVLTSKKGEGIFGMTYSVKGNADQPDLSINPLSVLAPGILRRIFEGNMPRAAQAPSNAPPPPGPVQPPAPAPGPAGPK
jgi:hypothetical protein